MIFETENLRTSCHSSYLGMHIWPSFIVPSGQVGSCLHIPQYRIPPSNLQKQVYSFTLEGSDTSPPGRWGQ